MDPSVYFAAAVIVCVLLFLLNKWKRSEGVAAAQGLLREAHGAAEAEAADGADDTAAGAAAAAGPVRRRGGRLLQARQRARERDGGAGSDQSSGDEEGAAATFDTIAMPDGKIGAKKMKKLEEKAERKAMREQMERDREENKKRQEMIAERQQKEMEKQKLAEAQKEEEERLKRAEKERQEHEEYLKMKESFVIEASGEDCAAGSEESEESLLSKFVEFIKQKKVIMLEDLATKFSLKTQDAASRVESLLKDEVLTGVFDDRGKFVYITAEEMAAVAKFIKQRGRVSIGELAECSNKLIRLASPDG